jgi:hypothetical protein
MGGESGAYEKQERRIEGFGGERGGVYEGKRPLGRSRRIWENNITMCLQEDGWEAWTALIWFRRGARGRSL